MCGIVGGLQDAAGGEFVKLAIARMTDAVGHRGPDDHGVWVGGDGRVALGHRRLSIIDLSPEGHQPMVSRDRRWVLSFNGEIYNYRDLRRRLESSGSTFRGSSDTEVLLEAIAAWGIERALRESNGMFAVAIWDERERVLHLARDRMGEKPLYYGWWKGAFLFASELKALQAYPGFSPAINREALALFLRHNYVPAPYSIYHRIAKLLPAHLLSLKLDAAPGAEEIRSYWDIDAVALRGLNEPFTGGAQEAVEALDALLGDSVALRMVADVPVGAFLSGGIDSSLVVALMQEQGTQPARTFTIGFHEAGYDEAGYAKAVAGHLGTDHTELYVTPEEAQSVIPRLPTMYDEPFADSSQIPTFLVAEMTRQHVKVALSGDGGDELFAGYDRYLYHTRLARGMRRVPAGLRALAARGLSGIAQESWDRMLSRAGRVLPPARRLSRPGAKLHKLAGALGNRGEEDLYLSLVSHWEDPTLLVAGSGEPPTIVSDVSRWLPASAGIGRLQHIDQRSYLPDDILVKVDRATMAVSLEARVPLLDHRIVEFAWRLPLALKVRDGQGKWILRELLARRVPRPMFERPKMGFGVPVGDWLRGPLREWAEELLRERRLRDEGFFAPAPIRAAWQAHLQGGGNWHYHLWDVLMFQAWHEAQRVPGSTEVRA